MSISVWYNRVVVIVVPIRSSRYICACATVFQ
jgi:hypothetical protein